ncbi:MAG: hypothetical protein JW720_11785 [Sedimentisphaerales bacterium]|nr:hypothetical protein [Sedimentisphaerales bacterium]
MELIKKIKQAEADARRIVEDAKAQAIKKADQAAKDTQARMQKAEQDRRDAIAAAVAGAADQGRKEVEAIKADADQKKARLQEDTKQKIERAIEKVVNYVKG